jgi:hypothetical protein
MKMLITVLTCQDGMPQALQTLMNNPSMNMTPQAKLQL